MSYWPFPHLHFLGSDILFLPPTDSLTRYHGIGHYMFPSWEGRLVHSPNLTQSTNARGVSFRSCPPPSHPVQTKTCLILLPRPTFLRGPSPGPLLAWPLPRPMLFPASLKPNYAPPFTACTSGRIPPRSFHSLTVFLLISFLTAGSG